MGAWRRLTKKVQEKETNENRTRKEDIIQEEFPKAMRRLFPELGFHDTHTHDFIAPPQKPDLTVIHPGHYLHTQSVVALIELHHTGNPIDGSMKGQVISAVRRVHSDLYLLKIIIGRTKKRKILSQPFFAEGKPKMAEAVASQLLLGLLVRVSGEVNSITFPKIEPSKYQVKCRLWRPPKS
mmetsp:Transcript_12307/g.18774  ORF Transcript_12307/g.18774 Transcript_12307/m.18774 type:complete len:181 (-) Transcript_12307:742-1284(-)